MSVRNFNVRSLLFSLFVLPVLALIYWIVNAQGMRTSLPIFAMKLFKVPIPGFSFLQHFQNLRDLDLAHAFAIFMLLAVWILGIALLEIFLFGSQAVPRLDTKRHRRFLYLLSAIVIFSDVVMFYRGIVDQGGLLDSAGGITPLIATVGYSGLLAFVAYVHVMLKHRLV